jgi:4-hydroxybenzoate polyprenyltransferase
MRSPLAVKAPGSFWPYVQIARVDHWFKNAFMLLGVVLAFFYDPRLFSWSSVIQLGLAVLATCLIASSNYVINELIDAPHDRLHPVKKSRPVPSGMIQPVYAVLEWLLLGALGIALACLLNPYFAASGIALWSMGVVYNVPPLRTKELPYLDVLSESINNPLRLFLGWFALVPDKVPPLSLTLAYWMVGAFLMAMKRFAEYRHIGNREVAAQYRRSFGYYTENRLLVGILFYATFCALFSGIFIIRYHVELILFVPVAAGFFAYYLHLGLQDNSPVQNPEQLYKQRGFLLYMMLSVTFFVLLMFTRIPLLYDLFHIEISSFTPLWTLGSFPE